MSSAYPQEPWTALQELRDAANLSRVQLAARIGVCHSTIWRYENGLRGARDDKLYKLADVLNTTIATLRDTMPVPPSQPRSTKAKGAA